MARWRTERPLAARGCPVGGPESDQAARSARDVVVYLGQLVSSTSTDDRWPSRDGQGVNVDRPGRSDLTVGDHDPAPSPTQPSG